MICLEDLVPKRHIYQRFANRWEFEGIKKENNYKSYGITRLLRDLLQEFKEDLGDRACEQFSRFESTEQIPDES
jgi:hypothetical protein